jgi:hypothetical protein
LRAKTIKRSSFYTGSEATGLIRYNCRHPMSANTAATSGKPADVVREHLSVYLGAFTARSSVQMMAKQALSAAPESITLAQIPALLEALGPMLRTLLGKGGAEKVVAEIQWKLGL